MQTTIKNNSKAMSKNNKKPQNITPLEKENFLKEAKTMPQGKFSIIEKKGEDIRHRSPQKTSSNNFVRDLEQNLVLKHGVVYKEFADAVEECKLNYLQDRANGLFWTDGKMFISDDDMDRILQVQKKSIRNFYLNRKTDEPQFVGSIIKPSKIWKTLTKELDDQQEVLIVAPIEKQDPVIELTEQLKKIQEQLLEVLDQNKRLFEEIRSKDSIILKLTEKIETLTNVSKETLELRSDVDETSLDITSKTVVEEVKNEKPLIEKFEDDGIQANLTLNEEDSLKDAMKVLDNNIKLTPTQQSKVTNQGKRDVTSEKISEKSFSKTLSDNLKPSEQNFRQQEKQIKVNKPQRASTLVEFQPSKRAAIKKDPNCPKGITAVRWNQIKNENDQTKKDKMIQQEYLRIFKIEFFVLQRRWLVVFPKKRNPYLVSYKLVWETLAKNKIDVLWSAITKWKSSAQEFQLTKTTMTEQQKDWYKNQKD